MRMKQAAGFLLLSALLTAGGCKNSGKSATNSTSPNQSSVGAVDWPVRDTPGDTGVGPMAVGMSEAEIKQAVPEAQVVPVETPPAGLETPVLGVTSAGKGTVYVELKDGKAARFTVVDDALSTSYSARVGMPVSELEALYGEGQVVSVQGQPAVRFDTAAPLRFIVEGDRPPKDWAALVKQDPKITRIQVAESWEGA